MKDYFIVIVSIYLVITSLFTVLFFSGVRPAQVTTSVHELVRDSVKYKIVLVSGEVVLSTSVNVKKDTIAIRDANGLKITFLKNKVRKIVKVPGVQRDKRIFHFGTVSNPENSYMSDLLLTSDILWFVWVAIFMVISLKKNLDPWKGWAIVSVFCVIQSYITITVLDERAGAIFFVIPNVSTVMQYLFPNIGMTLLWLIQILILVIVPTLILYVLSKRTMSKKIRKLKNNVEQ